jgi:flagellar basal body-associated protein FliL
MKKILIIVIALMVVGAAAVYFFVVPKPPEPDMVSTYVPGDYFVTNIKDSKALLKTTVVLEIKDKKSEDEKLKAKLEENSSVIRNAIIFTLREKTEPELRATDIEEKLRTEIVAKLNKELGIDNITSIYFNDYVLQ